jgi:ABC-type Fe3+ transport system substrate-binding protein
MTDDICIISFTFSVPIIMERKFKQPVCWQERSGVSVRLAYFVPNNVGSSAIALRPPNPHGAVLMADFLLSPDGQKVLEKFHYGSANERAAV